MKQTDDKKIAESFAPIAKNLQDVEKYTDNFGELFQKTSRTAKKNLTPILQSSRSQTPKLVSVSDEPFKNFSKMNDSKNFSEVLRDPEGNDIIPLRGNRVRIKNEECDLTPEIHTAFPDTR